MLYPNQYFYNDDKIDDTEIQVYSYSIKDTKFAQTLKKGKEKEQGRNGAIYLAYHVTNRNLKKVFYE